MLENHNPKQFTNWVKPSRKQLEQEFHVEQELKGHRFFPSLEAFLKAVEKAVPTKITEQMDRKIGYRSRTTDEEDLLGLIRSYRSYPEFRNEKTVRAIYEGFENNSPMDHPLVLEFQNGERRVFSGNTRMDVAFQLGIEPVVLIVKTDY